MKITNSNVKTGQEVIDEIVKAVQGIAYGEVTIVMHDSKIVQIERKEKKRFPKGVILFRNSRGE
jgi:hypothetical protein